MKFKFLFFISVVLSVFTLNCSKPLEAEQSPAVADENKVSEVKGEQISPLKTETPEEKAVRIAEEFIARNGYTEVQADKSNLSHETVEFYKDIDELLAFRQNTLEPKAFGVLYHGRLHDNKGWTVVFRYSERFRKMNERERKKFPAPINLKEIGRAVTMNENFESLSVEHKDFFLAKVEKRLEH
jgi:hypothetical protein